MKKVLIYLVLITVIWGTPLRAAASEDIAAGSEETAAEITNSLNEETVEKEETGDTAGTSCTADTDVNAKNIPACEEVPAEEALILDPGPDEKASPSVVYTTHVQTYGWLDPASDGVENGTTGESKRMEGIRISLENSPYSGSVQYRAHVQTYGWQDVRSDGQTAGTTGESRRVEAVRINLTGEMADHYDIWYQTHVQHFGWTGWAENGESCGSAGYSYRLEALRVLLLPKGAPAPGKVTGIFYENGNVAADGMSAYEGTLIRYNTHVQSFGWQNSVFDGATAGTIGLSRRLEGIRISLNNMPGSSIRYRTHVQSYGWMGWKENGQIAGTAGESKRLEAIQIELTGAAANTYDVYYRVHCQSFGWMGWTRNGQIAGTEGMRKRLEAIEIQLVEKNAPMPGYDPAHAYKRAIQGSTVTWIGDSYSAINRNVIAAKLPGADLQVQSGKFISFWHGGGGTPGIPLAQSLKQHGQLRRTVVFALGTNSNDGFEQQELDQVRSLFGDSYKVVFTTARTNISSYAGGNALLRSFVAQYPNYYLYDWAAGFQPSYMGGDGIHPNAAGIDVWTDGIIDVLNMTQ